MTEGGFHRRLSYDKLTSLSGVNSDNYHQFSNDSAVGLTDVCVWGGGGNGGRIQTKFYLACQDMKLNEDLNAKNV